MADTKFKAYKRFVQRIRDERGNRCQACKRTAEEARDARLTVHHLLPVAQSGIDDALATSPCNVLLLCGYCHKLQHPGARSWPWDMASRTRAKALG